MNINIMRYSDQTFSAYESTAIDAHEIDDIAFFDFENWLIDNQVEQLPYQRSYTRQNNHVSAHALGKINEHTDYSMGEGEYLLTTKQSAVFLLRFKTGKI